MVTHYGENALIRRYVHDTLFSLRIWILSDIIEYGSRIILRKTLKNEFGYIHLASILEIDMNIDIHITGSSGYRDNPNIHSIFHPYTQDKPEVYER